MGTFAGEFSYSISFGLIFIFLATLYRGIERQKFDWLFTINCLLLACIVLTHLITLIALIIIVPSYYFINRKWSCAKYIIAVFAVGFFLSAFWSLPFVLLINWTPEMNWTNLKEIKKLFPLELIPALLLAAAGLFFSTIKKDRKMVPVTWTVIIFMSLFFTWNSGRLYNARFLPFIFIFIYLIAAYGLSSFYWMFATIYPLKKKDVQNSVLCDSAKDVNHDAPIPDKKLKISFPGFQNKFYKFIIFVSIPLVAFLGAGAILAGSPLGPAWARHNYTGFEDKADWKLYDSLMKYLDSLPYGRVMFEFNKSIIQKFGTPRSLELIPFWTHQAGMEGLLVESSLTAPFHYINQAELSVKPRGTVAGWKVPSRNYEDAMTHLKYMNISYIMASSPEVQEDLDRDSSVVFLNKIDPYYFYEIKGPHNYVEILENMPFRYKPQDNWVWEMRDWYLNAGNIDNPVIFDDGSAGMNRFLQINKESLSNVPENPVKDNKGKVLLESVEREKIEFETTAIGQPHLIKVSYFPNWKVSGAEGPYLVSPSFMLVFPTQNRVTLYYGMTYANIIGVTLSISGWIIIAAILIFNLIVFIRLKKNP